MPVVTANTSRFPRHTITQALERLRCQRGFTVVEMVVALALFVAISSAFTYSLLPGNDHESDVPSDQTTAFRLPAPENASEMLPEDPAVKPECGRARHDVSSDR